MRCPFLDMEGSSRTEWYKSLVVQALEKSAPIQHVDSDKYSSDYEVIFQDDFTDIDSSSDTEKILNSDSDEENKLLYLTKMGYSEAEASIAIERYGPYSSIAELTDFICDAPKVKATDTLLLNVVLAPVRVWTEMSSAKLTERIRKALKAYDDEPPSSIQKYVLDECQKWNLVWVGRNKVVPLEPDEVEMLLVTASSAASRYPPTYPTLPEPWKVINFKFINLLKDIMDIILTRKIIDMEEVAMMYQDLSQYHGITRVQIVNLFIPIIHLNGTYSSVM
ncbi:hypothetical protein F3Y22_tig00000541pilonHSYRG00130 [Hibiscus syriacus]|uniref:DNA (Cytosine-5)-methyltransferase DRM1/2 n=1 Tax=Hibiscus syriacus TaxID=106335 RepID=A0A6A3D069_HIBSY|nr:hypothetical protein F3Y22_tig00000541pilonHSYRG00130 [Hibiscus syriacus]